MLGLIAPIGDSSVVAYVVRSRWSNPVFFSFSFPKRVPEDCLLFLIGVQVCFVRSGIFFFFSFYFRDFEKRSIGLDRSRSVPTRSIRNVFRYLPINGGDRGYVVLRTNPFCQQPVSYLPSEHRWIVPLVIRDRVDYRWRCHFRLGTTYHAGLEAAGFVIPVVRKKKRKEQNKRSK